MILLILALSIPIYVFVKLLERSAWNGADVDSSVQQMILQVAKTSRGFPQISLGRNLSNKATMRGSTWKGTVEYEATVNSSPSTLRISWEERVGLNVITKIETLSDGVASSIIWRRELPNQHLSTTEQAKSGDGEASGQR